MQLQCTIVAKTYLQINIKMIKEQVAYVLLVQYKTTSSEIRSMWIYFCWAVNFYSVTARFQWRHQLLIAFLLCVTNTTYQYSFASMSNQSGAATRIRDLPRKRQRKISLKRCNFRSLKPLISITNFGNLHFQQVLASLSIFHINADWCGETGETWWTQQ